jgi:anti-sigma B factor antagonist
MQPPFAITIDEFGDTAVIRLTGEIDATRCAEVEEAVAATMAEGCVHLVVDATEVTFCDSMGLRMFLGLLDRARQAGGWLRLAGVHGVLARLLEVTGLRSVIPIDPDVPSAMQARIS